MSIHDQRDEIDFQRGQTSAIAGGSTPLEDFFAGNPSRAFQLVGQTRRGMTWNNYAGFVQDDWRVTQKLMVNLGLRYSYLSPIKEDHNLLGGFDPTSQFGMIQEGQPSVGDTLFKPDRKNFSPRVGFAWDVTGKGTTVVRSGASVIYSMFTPSTFMQACCQNFSNGSWGAVPTGACQTVVAPGTLLPGNLWRQHRKRRRLSECLRPQREQRPCFSGWRRGQLHRWQAVQSGRDQQESRPALRL